MRWKQGVSLFCRSKGTHPGAVLAPRDTRWCLGDRHLCLSPWGPGMRLHILQCSGWPKSENDPALNIRAKAEKPCPTAQSRPLINVSKKQIYQTILPAVKQFVQENSLVIQWLRLHAFTAKGPGSVPGGGSKIPQAASVQFSRSVMSNTLRPHESKHARPPCPSPTQGFYPNSCPSSPWRHPAISSSVVPFSSCPQSLPASESFPMSHLFASGGQSIGVSASASGLPMNTQDWSPLGWTGL